jgi:hypothetical protein
VADDRVYVLCEGCGREVDAGAPDTVRVRVERFATFGGTQVADGMPVVFHDRCYPGGPDYRRAD